MRPKPAVGWESQDAALLIDGDFLWGQVDELGHPKSVVWAVNAFVNANCIYLFAP